MKHEHRPLAYLPDERLVYEDDLDLTWREIVKAAIGWTLIFAMGFAVLLLAAVQ